jgi:hypothetical protein
MNKLAYYYVSLLLKSDKEIFLSHQLTMLINVLYPCYNLSSHMSCSILLEKEKEEEKQEQQWQIEPGIPVCAANLSSPVVDQANYIGEIHYRIGGRVYIENAD